MGNIIFEDQFKMNMQELIKNKQVKKKLKIIYKEKQGKLLNVKSCEILEYIQTIKQHLDYRGRVPIIFQHNCKILLDLEEKQRTFESCKICKEKINKNRNQGFCTKCNQETPFRHAYCLKVKIIDANNQDCYCGVMFDIATDYLGIEARNFQLMALCSQNQYFQSINERKSQFQFLLLLQYVPDRNNFVIQKILQQLT